MQHDETTARPDAVPAIDARAMPALTRARAFVGAFGRGVAPPPRLVVAGVSFTAVAGHDGWLAWAPEPASGDTPTPAVRRGVAVHVSSGRPFGLTASDDLPTPDALRSVDGKFSLASMAPGRCRIATDCLGAGSVYYRVFGDALVFSDHLGLLLEVTDGPVEPNRLAIAALCIGQLQLTSETHVRGVHRLGAGEYLDAAIAPDTTLQARVRPYLSVVDALTSSPAIDGVEALDAAFREGILRERFGPRTALMLSGGRDSRALALVGHDQGFEGVTYGSALSTDMMWARRFARAAGLRHHRVPYEDWSFGDHAEVIVGLGGGAQGLQIANNLVGYAWAEGRFDLGVVGYMGDPTMGSHLGLDPQTPDRLFFDLLMGRTHPADVSLAEIFAPQIDDMRSIIHDRMAALRDLPRHQAHRILDFTIRQSTWISGMFSTCAWHLPLAYPFFHRPLLAGMFQADFNLLAGQSLYDRWLAWKQAQLGIRYRKTAWPERLLSLRTRMSKGMWPPTRVYWPEVYARSRPWLDAQLDCGIDYIDRITRESMRAMRPDSNADDPVLCMSMPLQLTFKRFGRTGRPTN